MTLLTDIVQLPIPKPEGFWPITVVGWITVLGFLGTVIWIIYQTGRWTEKIENYKRETASNCETIKNEATAALNGFGDRVKRLELGQEHNDGRVDALEVQVARTQGQYEALIELIGEAKESVNAFRQGNAALGDKLEKKIDELKDQQNATKLHLSERLKVVETLLEQRG